VHEPPLRQGKTSKVPTLYRYIAIHIERRGGGGGGCRELCQEYLAPAWHTQVFFFELDIPPPQSRDFAYIENYSLLLLLL